MRAHRKLDAAVVILEVARVDNAICTSMNLYGDATRAPCVLKGRVMKYDRVRWNDRLGAVVDQHVDHIAVVWVRPVELAMVELQLCSHPADFQRRAAASRTKYIDV